ELIELQLEQTRQGYDAEQASFQQAVAIMLALILIGGLASGIGGIVFARNFLMRPLDDARRFADDIASGNLGTHIQIRRDDEIGKLTGSLLKMQAELRNMVQLIQGNAEQMASASEALANSTGAISSATIQQSEAA